MAANPSFFDGLFQRFFSTTPSSPVVNDNTDNTLLTIRVAGNKGVGKTCVLLQFIYKKYTDDFISTLGVDFCVKEINLSQSSVKLKVYTEPQSHCEIINAQLPGKKKKEALIVFFDVTDRDSLKYAYDYIKDLSNDITYMVAATKCDSPDFLWSTDKDSISNTFGEEHVVYTSAKNGTGINELFTAVASAALADQLQKAPSASPKK